MKNYIVSVASEKVSLSADDVLNLDLSKVDDNKYHLLHNNKSYHLELISKDASSKKMTLSVNGNLHTIAIADEYDQMVEKMGLLATKSTKVNDIKAPMPGLIMEISVKEGEEIKEGDQLVVLSAMKMENILSAPNGGIVKSIEVKNDDAVEKGQILIVLE